MQIENVKAPVLAAQGLSETDLLASAITSENNPALRTMQARRLSRRCAISAAMALAVCPFVFGEAH